MTPITDLLTLTTFLGELATTIPGVAHFLPLGNGEDAVDEIAAYYTNDYEGPTVFLQVAEIPLKRNSHNAPMVTFFCSLTVAIKPESTAAADKLVARNQAMRMLFALIGVIDTAADDSQREVEEPGVGYDVVISTTDRVFPVGQMANVFLQGFYTDLDVSIAANHLLYPEN